MKNLLKKIYKINKKISLFLWNQFLLLSTRSKIIVIILILLISLFDSSNEEDDSLTTVQDTTTTVQDTTTTVQDTTTTVQDTTTTVQDTTTTSKPKNNVCLSWISQTKTNQRKMEEILDTYVKSTENYLNNSISIEEHIATLDDLEDQTLAIYLNQEDLKPNKSNEESHDKYIFTFSTYRSAFINFSEALKTGDAFYSNQGNLDISDATSFSKEAVGYRYEC